MNETIIGWTDVSWNPASGCSKVSDGCRFCYAMTISAKFKQTTKPWTVQNEAENVVIKPHKLHEPYTLGDKPQRCFVNSTSDLFHRVIPDWYRAAVFCVMLDLPHIIFQVLTKRSEALIDWHDRFIAAVRSPEFEQFAASVKHKKVKAALDKATAYPTPWGANIWQGVSVEDARVIQRIEHLRQSRAAVKFISAEPLLGPWGPVDLSSIDWIIVGGESGKHLNQNPERFMKQEWAREIKRLCIDQHTAFFYKQDSGHTTELRKYLVEEDGSLWRWNQYPNDFCPPMFVSTKDEPLHPVKFQHNDADPTVERSFEDCLHLAQLAEHAAYERAVAVPTAPHWSENAALAAAYWYDAAAKLRPALPLPPLREFAMMTPDGLVRGTADELAAMKAPSVEPITDLITDLPAAVEVTPIAPKADYADPYDLPTNAKTLSLWQPWASLMLIGAKQIETRSWQTPFKGTLVIHAAKKWDKDLQQIANSEPFASALRAAGLDPNTLPLGAALGAVVLDRCVSVDHLTGISEMERAFGDYSAGRFGWLTSRPRPFREPLPVAGEQGLRDWSSYLAKTGKPIGFDAITEPDAPDEPPTSLFVDKVVIVPGQDPNLVRGRIKKLQDGEAMIAFNQQATWVPYREVQSHPEATTTVYTARVDSRDEDAIDITVKSASTEIGAFFAPTWDMVNGVKSGKISESQYTAMYEALLRSRYSGNEKMLRVFLGDRRRVVFTCYCAVGEFCHRHLAVNVLEKIGMKFGYTVVHGGELEPPKPEAPPVQMSMFDLKTYV